VTWDGSGRITGLVDAAGRGVAIAYDANGRPGTITYPGGLTVQRTYEVSDLMDDEVPLATYTGVDGVMWSYDHDADYRIAAATGPGGAITTYDRDERGRVTEVTDALMRTTTYDWSGGLDQVTSPAGRIQTWTYDALGQPATWTRADATTITYGHADELSTMTLPGGATFELERFPDVGAIQERGAPGGTITTWAGERGRIEHLTTGDGGSVALSYAAGGKLSSITARTPGGATFATAYVYDAGGRLIEIHDPSGEVTEYTYDTAGRITRIDRPDGNHTEYTYGALDRPTQIRHYAGAVLARQYGYTYDARGRVIGEATPEGTFEYAYDTFGRLAVERELDGASVIETITYTWNAVGNETSRTDGSGTTTFTYDADDRLLSEAGPGGTTTYTYGARGQLTHVIAPGGTTIYAYDALDRLTSVTMPGGAQVSYAYDVTGRLRARTDAAGTRRCLPLPVTPRGHDDCAVTYATAGAEAAEALVFGPTGIASAHGATARHAWTARSGTVVAVTDATGAVAGTATYDPWGARGALGADLGYGYTGERQDPVTGLVFLRARWYSPALGRFLTPDPAEADPRDPRTLHRYAYASSDPLNRTDPTGRMFLVEVMSVQTIQNILNRISNVIKVCVYQRARKNIYKAVANWVLQQGSAMAFDILAQAAASVVPGDLEDALEQALAKYLCGSKTGPDFGAVIGSVEFFVPIKECGDVGSKDPFDCDAYADKPYLVPGLDLLIAGKIPVELKKDQAAVLKDYSQRQLIRTCRFAAKNGIRTVIYGYADFPDEPTHTANALTCWKCWDDGQLGSCGGGWSVGSIYTAFGFAKGGKVGFYVPDPDKLGCGG
jgi:RHS repeat-associated protein